MIQDGVLRASTILVMDNMHFRDKIKWTAPDGNDYDVYGRTSPDPYFGYWRRYVEIINNPAPYPTGTGNKFVVGSGGNY
jgi:hypothetical protein